MLARTIGILGLVLACLGTPPVEGASTVTCHCFRDRSYDPDRPGAADAYILATSRNSLLAAAFGVSKGTIVRALMTGTPPEDLWIAHAVAARTGLNARDLLNARRRSPSWARAVASLGVDPARLDPALSAAVQTGRAAPVVDRVLEERLRVPGKLVRRLREQGAPDGAAVAASLLYRITGEEPAAVFGDVVAGKATWGQKFQQAGLAPTDIDDAIAARLRPGG